MLRDAYFQFMSYSWAMRDEDSGLKMLPIFPLNAVLMPHQLMPLHIFENRYRSLMADLLALPEPEQRFGIVSITKGSETNEDLPAIAEIGTIAVLRKTNTNADGTLADYGVKGIENERASVGVAGVIGVIGTAVVAGIGFKLIARKPKKDGN